MDFYKNIFEYNRIGRFDYFLLWFSNIIILMFFITIINFFNLWKSTFFGFFGLLLLFILSFFGILASIKRFHDINMSGWHCLCLFIPFISIIFHLILLFKSGDEGLNRFGPSPKDLEDLDEKLKNNEISKEFFEKEMKKLYEDKEIIKSNTNNLENELINLKNLFEKNLISEQEYEAKKKKILDL